MSPMQIGEDLDDQGHVPGDEPEEVPEFQRPGQVRNFGWSKARPPCVEERQAHVFRRFKAGTCPYCGTMRKGGPHVWSYLAGEWSGVSFAKKRIERWEGR